MEIQPYEYLLIALSSGQLIAMIVGFLKFFRQPSERANDRIGILKTACEIRHQRIDEILAETRDQFKNIDNRLLLLKENDIKHIENEMRRMSDVQTKILTILEYEKKKEVNP